MLRKPCSELMAQRKLHSKLSGKSTVGRGGLGVWTGAGSPRFQGLKLTVALSVQELSLMRCPATHRCLMLFRMPSWQGSKKTTQQICKNIQWEFFIICLSFLTYVTFVTSISFQCKPPSIVFFALQTARVVYASRPLTRPRLVAPALRHQGPAVAVADSNRSASYH